jgi:hypothetical protein
MRTRAHARNLVGVGALLSCGIAGSAACSLVVDADRVQCSTDGDCVRAGVDPHATCIAHVCTASVVDVDAGEVDAGDIAWRCIGKLPPLAAEQSTPSVTIKINLFDVITNEVRPGLPLRACSWSDPTCLAPVRDSATMTDDGGNAQLLVPIGFRGFVDVAPTASQDILPALVAIAPMPDYADAAALSMNARMPLLTNDELAFLLSSVQKSAGPEYGHLFFNALDCLGRGSAGLTVHVKTQSPETFVFYTDPEGTPSLTQQETSSAGYGGYMNLPPGPAIVTMSQSTGAIIGTQQIVLRAKSITYVVLGPTP